MNKIPDNLEDKIIMLKGIYHTFNTRDIDNTLQQMHEDVEWPNGMEGGIEHGHEAVRMYWTRQWSMIDPKVVPENFVVDEDGRINVTVNQVVHDLDGNLLSDQIVHHIYQIEEGLIRSMEISKP